MDDISGIEEYKIEALALGEYAKWEIALLDFCMPNNVETFPSVDIENKSAAFMGMRVEYTWHGKKRQHSFDSHLTHAKYDIPSCVEKINANLKDCWVE